MRKEPVFTAVYLGLVTPDRGALLEAAFGRVGPVRRCFSWDRKAERLLHFYDDLLVPAGRGGVLRRTES